ncbi:MAG TPA: isoprenylcysteine carboxylmethyltransferase family protein [Thermoanaerobaculia bacterium]|nr:isoprenylcysteine carboxylmethyltransferase family protein [Thermoanaerobaculia bacterium]
MSGSGTLTAGDVRVDVAPPPPSGGATGDAVGRLPRWLEPPGHFLFKHRNWVFPMVFVALVGFTYPKPFLGSLRADAWLGAVSVALAFVGQLLRAAVIGLAYIRRGGLDKKVYADSLVVDGFFSHSRNPLYVGNYLALVGMLVLHNSLVGYAVGLPFFTFAYLSIVAAEESFLRDKFGAQYDDYCRRVPRFRLRLTGLGRTLRSMQFDWRRLVRKEYGSTFSGATAILALLLWEAWRQGGEPALRGRIDVIAPIWALLVVFYLTARLLKKRGALG